MVVYLPAAHYLLVIICLQILARQLAEVLLRGVCERTYRSIDVTANTSDSSHPKPRTYGGEKYDIFSIYKYLAQRIFI
jgi:hypothetical protein